MTLVNAETGEIVHVEPIDTQIPIDDIRIGQRIRQDLGDLSDLIASIREHRLMNPVSVYQDNEGTYWLIAGERRLEAIRQMSMYGDRVPCRVWPAGTTREQAQAMENDENECRKDFSLAEASAYYESIRLTPEERGSLKGSGRTSSSGSSNTPALDNAAATTGWSAGQIKSHQYLKNRSGSRDVAVAEKSREILALVDSGHMPPTTGERHVREFCRTHTSEADIPQERRPAGQSKAAQKRAEKEAAEIQRRLELLLTAVDSVGTIAEAIGAGWCTHIHDEHLELWDQARVPAMRAMKKLTEHIKGER